MRTIEATYKFKFKFKKFFFIKRYVYWENTS